MKKRLFAMILVMMLFLTSMPADVLAKEKGQKKDSEGQNITEVFEDKITVEVKNAPTGAKLVLTKPSQDTYKDAITEDLGSEYEELMALDISLSTEDGSALKDKVAVKIQSDDFKTLSKDAVLYHVKDGKAERVDYKLKDKKGIIKFKTNAFSPYILIHPVEPKEPEEVKEETSEVTKEPEVKEEPKKESEVADKPSEPKKETEVADKPSEPKKESEVADKPSDTKKETEVADKPSEPKKESEVADKPSDTKEDTKEDSKKEDSKKEDSKKETTVSDDKKEDAKTEETEKPSPVEVVFSGKVTLKGWDLKADDFKFTLKGTDKATELTKETVKNDADGKITFSKLTFLSEGVYHFAISEKAGSRAGVTYDEKVYNLIVTVTADRNGKLAAEISGDSTTGTDINFKNTYKPAPVKVQFSGTKTLTGKKLTAKEFSFTLKGSNTAAEETTETVKNDADGKIKFSKLTFKKAGVYTYTVKEKNSKEPGIAYDEKTYKITVTVTDDGKGQLKADISGDTTTGKDLNFKNKYQTGSLMISKTVKGDLGDKKKLFTFTVTFDVDGSYPFTGSKEGTISSGKMIDLKDGESITITGIPAGVSYKVVESEYKDYTVYKTGDSGSILPDQKVHASFTNTKSSVPKTGDNSNLPLWYGLLIASFLGILGMVAYTMKKRK